MASQPREQRPLRASERGGRALGEAEARALEAEAEPFEPEKIRVVGRQVYVHYVHGSGRSKLAPIVARRLGPRATSRNWTTVLALHALATSA